MLKFSKYHGCGNDFILVNEEDAPHELRDEQQLPQFVRAICARTTGIGADGLIIVRRNPLEMLIYNSDGSRAPMCGNGIRCFAHHCFDADIVSPALREYEVNTLAGLMKVQIESTDPFVVTIDMGKPDFRPESISLNLSAVGRNEDDSLCAAGVASRASNSSEKTATHSEAFFNQELDVGGHMLNVSSFFMGTVHSVVPVDEQSDLLLESGELAVLYRKTANGGFEVTESLTLLGRRLSEHPIYSEKTNVNFVRILDKETIEMITYERGAGLTAACGTGACAAAVCGYLSGKLGDSVRVLLPFGSLRIRIDETGEVYMTGPSVRAATGKYYADNTNAAEF